MPRGVVTCLVRERSAGGPPAWGLQRGPRRLHRSADFTPHAFAHRADAPALVRLQDTMAPAGAIESAEIAADAGGRSRGYGTVRYSTKEGADAAVATLNGVEFEGRTLTVKLDRYG